MRLKTRTSRSRRAILIATWLLAAGILDEACSLGQQPADAAISALQPIHLRLKRFEIPFTVDSLGKRPTEVQLFVSRDAGKQWIRFATQPPTGRSFLFDARGEGEYWFATRTIDSEGNQHPDGAIEPQLRVQIDLTDPQVDLHAEITQDANIAIDVRCIDASPDRQTLRIEYLTDVSGTWLEVPSLNESLRQDQPDQLEAKLAIVPAGDWHQVSLRAIVKDHAGNQTIATHQLQRPRVAVAPGQFASSPLTRSVASSSGQIAQPPINPYAVKAMQIINPPPANFVPVDTSRTQGSQVSPTLSGFGPFMAAAAPVPDASAPPPLAGLAIESLPTPRADSPIGTDVGSSNQPTLLGPAQNLPTGSSASSGANRPTGPELITAPVRRPATAEQAMRPLSPEEVARPEPMVAPSPSQGQTSARPSLGTADTFQDPRIVSTTAAFDPSTISSPIRYGGSRKFSLDYEVEAAGRAGVEEVELWGTTDRGQTWKRWGADPDRQTPFDIETSNDGVYGFSIVVVAKNGLATPRPIAASPPDIFVVVDTVKPIVRITGANYGEADQTGSLLVSFACNDEHLAARPITLSFSESQRGPWTTIAAGLENSGGYAWPADPQLPRQIYLRIDATDLAGNTSSYVLESAIDVQGLAPRARIRGFNPITGIPSTTSPVPQTAAAPSSTLK